MSTFASIDLFVHCLFIVAALLGLGGWMLYALFEGIVGTIRMMFTNPF